MAEPVFARSFIPNGAILPQSQAGIPPQGGRAELRAALLGALRLAPALVIFSIALNILMLSGPLYMLQVYDRVLPARSEPTLLALSLILLLLFVAMACLDHARARLMARIAARFQDRLDRRVMRATLDLRLRGDPGAAQGLADLDAAGRMLASPALPALIDLPWTLIFGLLIFLFHPALGGLALAGGGLLIALACLGQRATRGPALRAADRGLATTLAGAEMQNGAETLRGLGMTDAALGHWAGLRGAALDQSAVAGDRAGAFTAASRNLRLLLQSAMLGLGAWLTLQGALTPGLMIAGSVLLARSLAPVETMLAHWPTIQRGREGWQRLATLLDRAPLARPGLALPRPAARLDLADLALGPPGQRRISLRGISLQLEPGQILGVIGPSGAGKTTLARALAGLAPPLGGQIRLGGAPLEHYPPDLYGRWIGYLPQQITLFPATIAQNIARLDPHPDPDAVLAAARRAGAHEMILALPQGYDSVIGPGGTGLSGGESQRIALARALYGDPVLLILDEANAHLDHPGSEALNAALRAMRAAGGIAVTLAHRPSALRECDLLLILEGGRARAFGPRDAVLRAAGLGPALPPREGVG